MEYSLSQLNKITNLNQLTVPQFINILNLVGLEVDNIFNESCKNSKETNISFDNISLLVKIPANREDLLIEKYFLQELSMSCLFEILNLWKKIKKNYSFLFQKNYTKYQNYSIVSTSSNLPEILFFSIEIRNLKSFIVPEWIQKKLKSAGLPVTNTFNDLLQLVIFEWGQLFNCFFTHGNFSSFYITQIQNKGNFFFNPITQKTVELPSGTIVLKNNSDEILTVLGNLNSFISTKADGRVFLEATFSTMENLTTHSEIFELFLRSKEFKKLFFENFRFAFQRLLTLIEIFDIAEIIPVIHCTSFSLKKIKEEKKILKIRKNSFQDVLNLKIIDQNIIEKTGLKIVANSPKNIFLEIPNSRKDLTREIDFLEEYSRYIGYTNFLEILPIQTSIISSKKRETLSFLKQFFLNYGFNEVFTNPILPYEESTKKFIRIKNPLNKELSILRTSLFDKLIEIFTMNSRLFLQSTNIFEVGRVFSKKDNSFFEENQLAIIFQYPFSILKENSNEWFSSLGLIENLLQNFGYSTLVKENFSEEISFFHPTKSVALKNNEKQLGIFGELHPKYRKNLSSKKSIYLFQLNLKYLYPEQLSTFPLVSKEYSKYPSITKDLSISIEKTISLIALKIFIQKNVQFLKLISFFDVYFEKMNYSFMNIGIRFEFQSFTETLTTEIIEQEMLKIRSLLKIEFSIIFRS